MVVIYDRHGRHEFFDTQEIKGRSLNRWHGWLCSTGQANIYIDHDGQVYRGTCRVGESLGHIDTGFDLADGWITCTRDACTCGTEIKLSKARDRTYRDLFGVYGVSLPQEIDLAQAAAVESPIHKGFYVHWDLGRRCNFDCSYCTSNLHNKFEAHKDQDLLVRTADRLMSEAEDRALTARFCFAGGEPTLHPGFLDLCTHIFERRHRNLVTTNGTRSADYWIKLIAVADAQISYHFEFVNPVKLCRNVEAVIEARRSAARHGRHVGYLRIKLLPQPNDFRRLAAAIEDLQAIPGFVEQVSLEIAPLRKIEPRQELMDYSPAQIRHFGRVF
ncbi:MAG: radical SAM protein [Alphaproteobacteria bacterium]|nr:radical SAM protein [Alphaproteobacteria bacterium]